MHAPCSLSFGHLVRAEQTSDTLSWQGRTPLRKRRPRRPKTRSLSRRPQSLAASRTVSVDHQEPGTYCPCITSPRARYIELQSSKLPSRPLDVHLDHSVPLGHSIYLARSNDHDHNGGTKLHRHRHPLPRPFQILHWLRKRLLYYRDVFILQR